MARKTTLAGREELHNHLGYEPRYLAHRHRISCAEAQQLITDIGPDRAKLDAAANVLKQRKTDAPADRNGTDVE